MASLSPNDHVSMATPSPPRSMIVDAAESPAQTGSLRGTIVCGIKQSPEAGAIVELALALSRRLQLRVVLAAIAEGIVDETGRPLESVTTRDAREGAQKLLARLVLEHRLPSSVECRAEVAEPAVGLARIAHEEGAELVLIGSRRSGLRGRRMRSNLLDELRATSRCPVVLVPPVR